MQTLRRATAIRTRRLGACRLTPYRPQARAAACLAMPACCRPPPRVALLAHLACLPWCHPSTCHVARLPAYQARAPPEPPVPAKRGARVRHANRCCTTTWAWVQGCPPPSSPPRCSSPHAAAPLSARPRQDPEGNPSLFGDTDRGLIYNETGWCVADEPLWRCPCILDGEGGKFCNTTFEPFCPNQCNGARRGVVAVRPAPRDRAPAGAAASARLPTELLCCRRARPCLLACRPRRVQARLLQVLPGLVRA